MDNLTHSLVGLTISKAGWEKDTPATQIVCILAANAPDLDLVSGIFGDRWTLLHYHRGITHSILGTVLLSLIIPSFFWLADLILSSWRRHAKPIRFRALLLGSLIAGATHPLMDWTNNYGVRPLLPWSGKWYYADLVFIVDPFIWLVLGGTAFLLTASSSWRLRLWSLSAAILTSLVIYAGAVRRAFDHPYIAITVWSAVLIGLFICHRGQYFRYRRKKVAFAGLALVVSYWGGLAFCHSAALDRIRREVTTLPLAHGERVTRVAAMPTLADPAHWLCIMETDRSLYRFELFLLDGADQPTNLVVFVKPNEAEASLIRLAERDRRAQVLLGFARFPVERVADHDCLTETLVQFADLRYTEPGHPRGSFSIELPVECPNRH
jgi:inner membrane protein